MKIKLLICVLLFPSFSFAMKRKKHESTPREHTDNSIGSVSLLDMPLDTIKDYYFFNNDNIKAIVSLKRTCTQFNTLFNLKLITTSSQNIHYLSSESLKCLSKNFNNYTDLLYLYGEKNDQTTFKLLWKNQSPNDLRIRTNFVNEFSLEQYSPDSGTKNIITLTPLLCFNTSHTLSLHAQGETAIKKIYRNYFVQTLRNNQPQQTYLALAGPVTKKIINIHLQKHNMGQSFALYHASLHPTTTFLELLLHHGADTSLMVHTNKNILHWLFDHENPIDALPEKVSLILQSYAQQFPSQTKLLNQITDAYQKIDSPLSCLIRRFNREKINLDEFFTLLSLLIKHGTNPHLVIRISRTSHHTALHDIQKDDISHDAITEHIKICREEYLLQQTITKS